jgi:hypothetical protein
MPILFFGDAASLVWPVRWVGGRFLEGSQDAWPGFADEGMAIINATLHKVKDTCDFNIVLI